MLRPAFPGPVSAWRHIQETIPDQMLCSYQYILQVPLDAMNEDRKLESLFSMMLFQREVETDNEDAEKFSAYSAENRGWQIQE